MTTPNFDMVMVTWLDACFAANEPPAPLELVTLGFLVYKGDDYITLAMESREDKTCRDYVTIPTMYVKEITHLKPRPKGGKVGS